MGGIVISPRAQTPLKAVDGADGGEKKRQIKGRGERKKAILPGLLACTNGEHGSSSNSRTLERVCVSLLHVC